MVGLGMEDSVTERCYSTGTVTADSKNAGGVVGYGYNGTVLRDCIALNDKVDGKHLFQPRGRTNQIRSSPSAGKQLRQRKGDGDRRAAGNRLCGHRKKELPPPWLRSMTKPSLKKPLDGILKFLAVG